MLLAATIDLSTSDKSISSASSGLPCPGPQSWQELRVCLARETPAAIADPSVRPPWCPAGWVCQPTIVDADQEATILERDAEVARLDAEMLRIRPRRGPRLWVEGGLQAAIDGEVVETFPYGAGGVRWGPVVAGADVSSLGTALRAAIRVEF
jgi:hypothetical protein